MWGLHGENYWQRVSNNSRELEFKASNLVLKNPVQLGANEWFHQVLSEYRCCQISSTTHIEVINIYHDRFG